MFKDLRSLIVPLIAIVMILLLLVVRFSETLRPAVADFVSPWLGAPDHVAEQMDPDSLFHYSKTDLIRRIEEQNAQIKDQERGTKRVDALLRENAELRGMLGLDMPVGYRGIPAQIVGMDPANGMRVFRIDRGSADGVEQGQPVLAGGFLVGRILETEKTGLHTSLVVTVIDPNCRASVKVLGVEKSGVIFGLPESRWLAEPRCLVKYLPRDLAYPENLEVVTADHDPQVPAGISVGRIEAHKGIAVETVDNLYRQVYVAPSAFRESFTAVTVLRRINNSARLTEETP